MSQALSFEDFESACQDNRLYQSLTPEERGHLFKLAKRQQIPAGEVLFYSSETDSSAFYIIEEGKLRLNLNSGKEKIYEEGELFGEISVLNGSPRMGTMTAIVDSSLIVIEGDLLFEEAMIPAQSSFSIFKGLVGYVISYLNEEYAHATERIIEKGEGVTIEFKESLSKKLKQEVVKTICAFLNTRGGTILLGVNDKAEVIGLDVDSEKDLDNYKQSIIQILKHKVGINGSTNIHFNTEKLDNKILLRINCTPSNHPIILEDKDGQYFYIRSGPTSIKAPNIKEVLSYYQERFESSNRFN